MTNVTFQKENNDTINLIVDGIECGKLELASEGFNDFRIEKVHIDEAQRGNGFYKMLLISCFSVLGAKTVRSEKEITDQTQFTRHGQEKNLKKKRLYGSRLTVRN